MLVSSQGFHSEGSGMGSTFFVDLPLFSVKEQSSPSPPLPPPLSQPAPPLVLEKDRNVSACSDGGKVDDDHDDKAKDGNDRKREAIFPTRQCYVTPVTPFSSDLDYKASAGAVSIAVPALTLPHQSRWRMLVVDDSSINRRVRR